MGKSELERLDGNVELREKLLPFCRLNYGEIWEDGKNGHKVGVLDAANKQDIDKICNGLPVALIVNDPPYNIAVGSRSTDALAKRSIPEYIEFSRKWVEASIEIMNEDSFLYVWMGADQTKHFQPLPDFMILMRDFDGLRSRSYITVRNQRGYGTQKNWMFIRQELLCYTKGNPNFNVLYTDIPKVLKGYHKLVGGRLTENMERSRSNTIRPGNVWIDIQQVFYRMEENVPGAYAQKPLAAIERIMESSSCPGDTVADFFAHTGSTLIAAEKLNRRCLTFDFDPIFAELTIRRLERFRSTGRTGWQWKNPFPELSSQRELFG